MKASDSCKIQVITGAGILLRGSASITINNCIFKNNLSRFGGGAIAIFYGASPIITDSIFIENGGGYWDTYGGGAIYVHADCSPKIINCIFSKNRVEGSGGAIGDSGTLFILNSTFSENYATYSGGTVYQSNTTETATIINSILWADFPNELYLENAPSPVFINCDIDEEGFAGNNGNIRQDPLFIGNGDYHLQYSSPCRDAGTDDVELPATDFEGDPRIVGPAPDIGADEHVFEITIDVILEFFDRCVDAGTLFGNGPGNSANNRLNALRNMLKSAADHISVGNIEGACGQLNSCYKKYDGGPKPPDFVKGIAAPDLLEMSEELMESLECE